MSNSDVPEIDSENRYGAVDLVEMSIDPDMARKIAAACQTWVDELRAMVLQCARISDVQGMGDLKSARDLAEKFSLKAVGGIDSLEKSLRSHIDVVTEMRDFFQKCVDRYESVDAANAAAYVATEIPR